MIIEIGVHKIGNKCNISNKNYQSPMISIFGLEFVGL